MFGFVATHISRNKKRARYGAPVICSADRFSVWHLLGGSQVSKREKWAPIPFLEGFRPFQFFTLACVCFEAFRRSQPHHSARWMTLHLSQIFFNDCPYLHVHPDLSFYL